MSKHVLISSIEVTVKAWVGDTEDGSAAPIALQPFTVRPHDLALWATQIWPGELAKLKGQLAAGEQAEAERLAVEELQATTAAELADLRQVVDELAKPRKAAKSTKKAPAKKVAAAKAPAVKKARATKKAKGDPEEAALRARSYQPPEASTT